LWHYFINRIRKLIVIYCHVCYEVKNDEKSMCTQLCNINNVWSVQYRNSSDVSIQRHTKKNDSAQAVWTVLYYTVLAPIKHNILEIAIKVVWPFKDFYQPYNFYYWFLWSVATSYYLHYLMYALNVTESYHPVVEEWKRRLHMKTSLLKQCWDI
jgi:hypothetical protein